MRGIVVFIFVEIWLLTAIAAFWGGWILSQNRNSNHSTNYTNYKLQVVESEIKERLRNHEGRIAAIETIQDHKYLIEKRRK